MFSSLSLLKRIFIFYFLIDKFHKYIDQKSIQEVYKAKAEKIAKAKGKKQQTKKTASIQEIFFYCHCLVNCDLGE